MVTLHHVLNFKITKIAASIRELKLHSLKKEIVERWVLDSETGVLKKTAYERVAEHISPKHPHWSRYVALKLECSRHLSALHLLKLGSGLPPAKKDVRKAIRAGRLNFHNHASVASKFLFEAYAVLLLEFERLNNHPEQYDDVARFVEKRAEEARRGIS